jgi:hypothetical protein
VEQENIACPAPGHRNGTCRSALRFGPASRRVETNPALEKPRALTWHAQLNCQRTFRPKVDLGSLHEDATGDEVGTTLSGVCHVRLSEHYEGDCPAVQFINVGYVAAGCQGVDFENFDASSEPPFAILPMQLYRLSPQRDEMSPPASERGVLVASHPLKNRESRARSLLATP